MREFTEEFKVRGLIRGILGRPPRQSIAEPPEEQGYDEETAGLIDGSIALLERMRSDGIDLAKRRTVTHLFLGLDRDLGRVAKLLIQKGYSIDEQGDGRLLLSQEAPFSEEWIGHVVRAMCQIAGEFDVTYDGWDVDVAGG